MVALPLPALRPPAFRVGDILQIPMGQRRLPVLDVRVSRATGTAFYKFDTGYGVKWYAQPELRAYKVIPFPEPEPPTPASSVGINPLRELITVFARNSRGAGVHSKTVLIERCATLRRETLTTMADMNPRYLVELNSVLEDIEAAKVAAESPVAFTRHLESASEVLRLAVKAAEKAAA